MNPTVRRFRSGDAAATREVFAEAVLVGAAPRYSEAERRDWVPDPAMPEDWGEWLDEHLTFVAEDAGGIVGFMMIERDGYLNMAFVRPEAMGKGVAGTLYAAILSEARGLGLTRLTAAASRFFQGFLIRRGWRVVPGLPERPDVTILDTPKDNPQNRAMALDLLPP
ncbi:MAG: N-acetyltransferase family protein [Paracoccaceae bacterium]